MPVSYSPSLNVSDSPSKAPTERFFSGGGGGGGGATLLVYDNYIPSVGTSESLFSHPVDVDNIGGGWQQYGDFAPTHTVEGTTFGYVICSGATHSAAGFDIGADNMPTIIEQEINLVSTALPPLLIRRVDDDNYIWARDAESAGTHTIQLYTREAGANTLRGSDAHAASIGDRLYVADTGDGINIGWNNGAAAISYSTTLFNTSYVYGLGNSTARAANIIWMGGTSDPADIPLEGDI